VPAARPIEPPAPEADDDPDAVPVAEGAPATPEADDDPAAVPVAARTTPPDPDAAEDPAAVPVVDGRVPTRSKTARDRDGGRTARKVPESQSTASRAGSGAGPLPAATARIEPVNGAVTLARRLAPSVNRLHVIAPTADAEAATWTPSK
jgi:hypothetical protein